MNRLKVNWFIVFWGVALITVLCLHFFYHTPEKYIGIVETKSHLIGVQEPGNIQNVLVSIGEKVKKGQVLVTLYFSDLETEINQLRDELTGIQKLKKAHQDRFSVEFQRTYLQLENEVSELTERLAILEAKRTELAGLNNEIERLKEAEEAGLGHTRDLADLIVQRDAIASYLRGQSEELQLQTQKLDKTRQTRQMLREADTDGVVESMLLEPMERAEELRREISLIEHRIHLRTLFAPCDGHVVEMFAHPGDVVEEFIPILTVEESNPGYLTVYIPERSDTHIEVGMQVRIYSPRLKRHVNPGVVTFINPGFSQTTERLWLQGQVLWARMVRVELENGHELLPGEKVLARVDGRREHRGELTISAQASEARAQGDDNQNSPYPSILKMELSQSLLETSRFEPSGIAWLENLKKFVIVSDDTGIEDSENDHAPWLFLMDEEGRVETTPVVLEGIDTVNDLEAIAPARNGIYYLISSQNTSKRGKRPKSREMILKIRQHNKTFQVQGMVLFLSLILKSYSGDQLKALGLGEVAEDGRPVLNIEGAAWWNDVLYLGLKSPVGEKGVLIWRLSNPHNLFESQKLKPGQLSVYGYVQLGIHKDRIATLSDLAFDTRGILWALSTIADAEEGDQMGGFHRIDRFADDHLEAIRIMRFPGLKPEGICVLGEDRFLIVFDEDKDIPSFCTIAMEDL